MSDTKKTALEAQIALLPPDKRAALLKRLNAASSSQTTAGDEPRLAPVPRDRPLALSFAQQRLWFIDKFEPGSGTYNVFEAHRMLGKLDREALEGALGDLVARHEALRTTFPLEGDEPVQRIAQPGGVRLDVIELGHLGTAERDAEMHRRLVAETERPFDLRSGPVFRATLIALGPEEHVLLNVIHHIATDGWSSGVLHRELVASYNARLRGEPADLPPLALQYADYAVWQRAWLEQGRLAAQLAFWKKALANVTPLELPTTHPRPAVQTSRGAHVSLRVPAKLIEGLETVARAEGATLYIVMLSAFAALMHRYSGLEDIAVGAPVANRQREELESIVGFFVNSVVLRCDLSGRPSVRTLVRRTRDVAVDAYANQDLPFDRLVEELQPQRDLSRSPLMQVMFALTNAPDGAVRFDGLRVEPVSVEHRSAKFDITVNVLREVDEGAVIDFEYRTDLFDAPAMERMLQQYVSLLDTFTKKPDAPIAYLPLMTATDRSTLDRWNDTRAVVEDLRLHETFEAQAARTPDAIALTYEGTELTYRALDERSNQLARYLMRLGVTVDSLVGISMERSPELVIGILGILKAGAAYAPLDPDNPRERVAFMLEDSGVPILLTQGRLREKLPTRADCRVIAIDEQWATIAAEPATSPRVKPPANALAYVIYTSGSTGKPKAAMNTHAAIANRLAWQQRTFRLTAGDRVLHKTAIGFDLSVWECLWPLLAGARLVLAKAGGQRDLAYQIDLITKQGVTFLHLMPSVIPVFIDLPGFEEWSKTIRQVVTGGEAISFETQERFFAKSRAALANCYGPSECAVDVTGWMCERGSARGMVPIGKPLSNIQIYIVDKNFELVPAGVPGELCIGGLAVGRGYHRRPDLTAEKFVPDPFSGVAGARLYRTGDLTRYMPDGNIEFLGRIDHQVKLRGFRIELGEIEAALSAHPSVKSAIVLVREDAPGDKRLVAYVATDEASPDGLTKPLQKKLGETLPEHMVPSAFVFLKAMPVTTSGKVDRKALPAPERKRDASVAYEPPRTPLETALAEMWAELLRVPRIGRNDHFFQTGGHSLLAMRLINQIRQKLEIDVPVRLVFDAPTLGAFAERVATCESAPADNVERLPRAPDAVFPLSFEQDVFWRWEQGHPGTATWIGVGALHLHGPVDVDVMKRAIDALVARHETLRTSCPVVDGKPVQKIHDHGRELAVLDLRKRSQTERDDEIRRVIEEENTQLFDLANEPMFRSRLLRLADDDHILFLKSHHLVVGGKWFDILESDLKALYHAFLHGKPDPLPALPFQYADYATWWWRRQQREAPAIQRNLAYWNKKLEGAKATILPREPGCAVSYAATVVRNYRFAPPPGTMPKVEALARKDGVTPFAILMASIKVLLHRHSGQSDIVMGMPTDRRRDTPDAAALMAANFTSNALVRTDLSGNPPFRELVKRVRQNLIDALEHELPLAVVRPVTDPSSNPLEDPLMRAILNYTPPDPEATPMPTPPGGFTAEYYPMPERRRVRKDCLLFLLGRAPDGLGGRILMPEGLMDERAGEELIAEYTRLLCSLIEDPDQPIGPTPGAGAS